MLKLFLTLATPILLAASPSNITALQQKCPPTVEAAGFSSSDNHHRRNLSDEPPGALIAAVDRRVDSCPILVVIDPKLAGQPAWIPPQNTPEASFQTTDD